MLTNTKQYIVGAALVAATLLLGACTNNADPYVPLAETPAAEQTQEEVQTQEVIEPDVSEPEAEDAVETIEAEAGETDAEPELGSHYPGVIRIRPLADIGHMTQPGTPQILDPDPNRGQGWVKFDDNHNLVFFSENPSVLAWVQAGMGANENHTLTLIADWGQSDVPGAQEAFEADKNNFWIIELEDPASIHDVEVSGPLWPGGYHTSFEDIALGQS